MRLRCSVRSAHPRRAWPAGPDSSGCALPAAAGRQCHSPIAPSQRHPRARPLQPSVSASGHGRGARCHAARRPRAADRSQCSLRQSAGIHRHRRGDLRRQLPRRAGGLCRGPADDGGVRDWRTVGTAHRPTHRCHDLRLARLPGRQSGRELRLHDRARDRGRPGQREQDPLPPGQRGLPAHLGQSGGSRQHGDLRRAQVARGGRQRAQDRGHRAARRLPRHRVQAATGVFAGIGSGACTGA